MPATLITESRREHLARRARWLLVATVAWNAVEMVVAVAAGIVAGSLALVGFGLDSLIEVFAASVVLWQYRGHLPAAREHLALRLIAVSFFLLAAYVGVEAAIALLQGSSARPSAVGIGLATVSLFVMPGLAIAKRATARALGSTSLLAESAETFLCAGLSLVLLIGLVLDALGWSWADPIAALVIAGLAFREGREAWAGEHCCAGTH